MPAHSEPARAPKRPSKKRSRFRSRVLRSSTQQSGTNRYELQKHIAFDLKDDKSAEQILAAPSSGPRRALTLPGSFPSSEASRYVVQSDSGDSSEEGGTLLHSTSEGHARSAPKELVQVPDALSSLGDREKDKRRTSTSLVGASSDCSAISDPQKPGSTRDMTISGSAPTQIVDTSGGPGSPRGPFPEPLFRGQTDLDHLNASEYSQDDILDDLSRLSDSGLLPEYVSPRQMSSQLDSMAGQISVSERRALQGSLSPYLATPVSYITFLAEITSSVEEDIRLFRTYVNVWIFVSVTTCRLDGLRFHYTIRLSPRTSAAANCTELLLKPARLAELASDTWFTDSTNQHIDRSVSTILESSNKPRRSLSQSSNSTKSLLAPAESNLVQDTPAIRDLRFTKSSFFVLGRVFEMRWHQYRDMGPGNARASFSGLPARGVNKSIRTTTRRFVVAQAKHGYCYAFPIYVSDGLDRSNNRLFKEQRRRHPVIYESRNSLKKMPGDQHLTKDSIAVDMEPGEALDYRSRLDSNNLKRINWNTKVRSVGSITGKRHLQILQSCFRTEILPENNAEEFASGNDNAEEDETEFIVESLDDQNSLSEYMVVSLPKHSRFKDGPAMRRVQSTQESSSNEPQRDYLTTIIRFAKGFVNNIPTGFGGH